MVFSGGRTAEFKGEVYSSCAFHTQGANRKYCEEQSSRLPLNRICSERKCQSPWRACRACIIQGGLKPDAAIDSAVGLCAWHFEHGAETSRPDVARHERRSLEASLPTGSKPVLEKSHTRSVVAFGSRSRNIPRDVKIEALCAAKAVMGNEPVVRYALAIAASEILRQKGYYPSRETLKAFTYTLTEAELKELGLK